MKYKVSLFLLTILFIFYGCETDVRKSQVVEDGNPPAPVLTTDPLDYSEELPNSKNDLLEISDQAYVSQSGAYKIALPKEWNCSETGEFQVNCQSPDRSAELQAKITATGYELDQAAFLSFVHAEMVNGYSSVKEYVEDERLENEGQLRFISTWRTGDTYWQGTDVFQKKNGTIFHLKTSVMEEFNENYKPLFAELSKTVEIIPTALQGVELYASRVEHSAPYSFFKVEIPTAWEKYIFPIVVKKTTVENYLSPDMRAAVQITVYQRGAVIEQALKGEKTLEIIRAQNGYDLRVSDDRALPDGREKLVWNAKRKGVNGISFFDSYGSSLFVFSIVWEDSTAYLYQPLLEDLAATFYRE